MKTTLLNKQQYHFQTDNEKENSKAIRVLMILSEAIKFGNYFTIKELTDLYGLSRKTIERDFKFIKEHAEFVEMEVSKEGKQIITMRGRPNKITRPKKPPLPLGISETYLVSRNEHLS